ncbi:hypothetical protein DFJ63DRAFT_186308 [Scheffersomyces coipomensis]|uniref:uncharacterized protein n=1 Tax=Scheffersomyces coipomensis TaxID=1788519 RepID=UPI00315D799A
MSQELAGACDKLLTSTSILSHTYGIPTITSTQDKIDDKINRLEQEHVKLYDELTHKLDELIYLNEVDQLQHDDEQTIQSKYEEIVHLYPMLPPIKLESFIKAHNSTIKTDLLLNNFIQLTGPILRSIHQDNTSLTNTELNILTNLDKLYALDNGLVFQIMQKFKSGKLHEQEYNQLLDDNEKLLIENLKPKLMALKDSNETLLSLHKQLINSKQQQVDGIDLDQDIIKQIESKYHDLVQQWNYLSKLCTFLPMLITSLPLNWYEDKTLFNIIQDCEDFSEKLDRYQTLLNVETIKDIDTKDLLMLDFDELINDNDNVNDL